MLTIRLTARAAAHAMRKIFRFLVSVEGSSTVSLPSD